MANEGSEADAGLLLGKVPWSEVGPRISHRRRGVADGSDDMARKENLMSEQNEIQIGGQHYKKGGEEHWDRAYRLKYDCYQYIITKWVERWKDKGGLMDLYKARHAINKYIEVIEREEKLRSVDRDAQVSVYSNPLRGAAAEGEGAGRGYVNQDPGGPELARR